MKILTEETNTISIPAKDLSGDNLYLDTSSGQNKLRIPSVKNLLPNTLANADSLQVTNDWGTHNWITGTGHTYYKQTDKISVESGAFKCTGTSATGNSNIFSLFFRSMGDVYASSNGITTYFPTNTGIQHTYSLDIKVPLGMSFYLGSYTFPSLSGTNTTLQTSYVGTGDYQRVSHTFSSQSYCTLLINFSNNTLGSNSFYIKDLCFNEGTNKDYIKSRIIDTGYKMPATVKSGTTGGTIAWTNPANITNMSVSTYAQASNLPITSGYTRALVATGFNLNIPTNAINTRTFQAYAYWNATTIRENNATGLCIYSSEAGNAGFMDTAEIKSGIAAQQVNVISRSNYGLNFTTANNSVNGCKILFANSGSTVATASVYWVAMRVWYELPADLTKASIITPIEERTHIDALHENCTFDLLDDGDNVINSNITLPYEMGGARLITLKIAKIPSDGYYAELGLLNKKTHEVIRYNIDSIKTISLDLPDNEYYIAIFTDKKYTPSLVMSTVKLNGLSLDEYKTHAIDYDFNPGGSMEAYMTDYAIHFDDGDILEWDWSL